MCSESPLERNIIGMWGIQALLEYQIFDYIIPMVLQRGTTQSVMSTCQQYRTTREWYIQMSKGHVHKARLRWNCDEPAESLSPKPLFSIPTYSSTTQAHWQGIC